MSPITLANESELLSAIRSRQFHLLFQPQICSNTNRPFGVEALVRWEHPQDGLLLPSGFIQSLERRDMIGVLGRWVLEEAIRHASDWSRLGWDARISVNLSARQIHSSLPNEVDALLHVNGLASKQLELELTESALVDDLEQTAHVLHALREIGVRIALDDFGAGFSSLSYLQNLPFDTLKIDRTFVSGRQATKDNRIVRWIIEIAKEMQLTTIAEGVETFEQMNTLKTLGCDGWQGFFHSPPLPASMLQEHFQPMPIPRTVSAYTV